MVPVDLLRGKISILLIILTIVASGCSSGEFSEKGNNDWTYRLLSWESNQDNHQSEEFKPGTYSIDLIFTDFYNAFGGESALGPAISIATTTDGVTQQYTEAGLMIFDPRESDSRRFSFAPLGLELGIGEGELLGKAYSSGRIISGFLVIADFLEEYEQMGGARFVGKPISEALYNPKKGRIEQYFENLGFYKVDGESTVQLMKYGAYACDRNCREQEPVAGIPILQSVLPEEFINKTIEIGLPFVGKPLTGVHFGTDGRLEVIFENVVLFAEDNSSQNVGIRPIVEQFGIYSQEPAESQNSPLNVFFEIDNGLGFDVPLHFVDFLAANGGTEVAGDPISHVFSPEPGVYWQCFTNICLEFNLNADEAEKLKPVPLGFDYKASQYDQVVDFQTSQALDRLEIKVWEKDPYVSSDDSQEIHVALYEDETQLINFEPVLLATMPDGDQRKAYFQPSDEDGRTSIGLAPINAPNGTLIAYKVCVFGFDGEPHCVGDNYLIWETD